MRLVFLLFFVLVIVFVTLFSGLNAGNTTLNYFIGTIELPVSVLIASSFVGGILLSVIIIGIPYRILQYRYKSLQKKLDQLNQQITEE